MGWKKTDNKILFIRKQTTEMHTEKKSTVLLTYSFFKSYVTQMYE